MLSVINLEGKRPWLAAITPLEVILPAIILPNDPVKLELILPEAVISLTIKLPLELIPLDAVTKLSVGAKVTWSPLIIVPKFPFVPKASASVVILESLYIALTLVPDPDMRISPSIIDKRLRTSTSPSSSTENFSSPSSLTLKSF